MLTSSGVSESISCQLCVTRVAVRGFKGVDAGWKSKGCGA